MSVQTNIFGTTSPAVVIQADARSLPLREESVDLIVTSPPYNVGVDYDGYNDNLSDEEYLQMMRDALVESKRVMRAGARICLVVPFGTGRNPWKPIGSWVTRLVDEIFTLAGILIWGKGSSGGRCTWGSWRSPVSPVLRDVCEMIIVAKRTGYLTIPEEAWAFDPKGRKVSPWLSAEQFPGLTQNLWHVRPSSRSQSNGHPAGFPIELAERLIRLYAYPRSIILDPFCGSGSTGIAALRLGAKAILCDISKEYCHLGRTRIANEIIF